MTLSEKFEQAKLDSKELREKPSNDVLLQLYSLFKQGTVGDVDDEAPTNPFDFVAKAKYTAWEEQKGKSKEVAMQDYIDLIEKLKD